MHYYEIITTNTIYYVYAKTRQDACDKFVGKTIVATRRITAHEMKLMLMKGLADPR